ncbi:MAG TPA: BTAD domain-containing putative transcriptional regulator, partial [Casimicrobiaceae bacterium]|nr:BTAD domain-containing putative transcriptional regulator [Casimicrobiaceae bacterium]
MTPSRPVPGALRLTLLGPAAAQSGTDAVRCTSRKAFALFAYLVLERRPHSRRALSSLFWGARDPEASRTSLRATLFRLPAPMAGCLAVERDTIGVALHAAIDCDAVAFDRLAADGGLDAAQKAATLYQGHLLADFEADATPEFDDWVSRERTRLKRAAWQVFERAIAWHADALPRAPGDAEARAREAAALARRWLALDPAAEPAHRWLIRLDVEAGRGDAALAQYESCRRALAVAEGRAPATDTKALVASLGRGAEAEPASGRPSAPPRPHEPAPIPRIASTSFVGRIEEVAEIARLVADPACRLITLHGLGGVGKTRLADAVARQVAGDFAHGVAWVALESVERPEAVAATIARALGLEAAPRTPPRNQLVQALRAQERLLVLDNLEHLLTPPVAEAADDPVDLVLALLREAPGVRLLVTSRETLGVQEEWVYDVEGLAHRHRAAVDDDAGVLPAVELFAQRARQAYLGFSLTAEMPHVRRVCALVDGLPLGIELAAAWVRTIPCAEIAQELERGVDALPAGQRNRPARQQTLRAVVEFSWRLLAPEQQDVLAALAQCHGGFSREAAEHVAQASLRTLSALVDKALVRRGPDSRFSLHPLVRRFAAEKLALTPARAARARTRHADHYLRLLCTQLGALHGPQHLESRTAIEDDLDNIRAAWAAKVDERDLDALGAAARPLALAFDRLGLYEEWTRTFERALGVVPASESRAGYRRLLLYAANGHWRQGDVAQADACRQRLDAVIATASDPSELAEYHKLAGLVVRDAGDIDGALARFELASAAAAQSGDRIIQAHIANEIGVVHWRHGALARARDAFVACLAQCE